MISSLRGIVKKLEVPFLVLDVQGVGYEVQCTAHLWEDSKEGIEAHIHTYTFVREDRLELFGFMSAPERKLFSHFLNIPGVGPKTALQLCSVPTSILCHAVEQEDTRSLSNVKGIGKKMAEKLLVELQTFMEKGILVPMAAPSGQIFSAIDEDALEALTNLGYDRRTILKRLQEISDAKTTEERVKRVLQTL